MSGNVQDSPEVIHEYMSMIIEGYAKSSGKFVYIRSPDIRMAPIANNKIDIEQAKKNLKVIVQNIDNNANKDKVTEALDYLKGYQDVDTKILNIIIQDYFLPFRVFAMNGQYFAKLDENFIKDMFLYSHLLQLSQTSTEEDFDIIHTNNNVVSKFHGTRLTDLNNLNFNSKSTIETWMTQLSSKYASLFMTVNETFGNLRRIRKRNDKYMTFFLIALSSFVDIVSTYPDAYPTMAFDTYKEAFTDNLMKMVFPLIPLVRGDTTFWFMKSNKFCQIVGMYKPTVLSHESHSNTSNTSNTNINLSEHLIKHNDPYFFNLSGGSIKTQKPKIVLKENNKEYAVFTDKHKRKYVRIRGENVLLSSIKRKYKTL